MGVFIMLKDEIPFRFSMDELDGEIKEYIDDGYSGTNFNRLAFQEMIEDAKKGKIDVLLVKDLSRLQKSPDAI